MHVDYICLEGFLTCWLLHSCWDVIIIILLFYYVIIIISLFHTQKPQQLSGLDPS